MDDKMIIADENNFEKSFTPRIDDIYENEYTNKEGAHKKQCFIKINDRASLILPYSKEEVLDKYKSEKFPETLNFGIVKSHTYHVRLTDKDNKNEFKDVTGTELRKLIDYYVFIGLDDAYIAETKFDPNKVNVAKNGVSFVVNKDWIKENEHGKYLSVKHNADIQITTPVFEKDAEGKYQPKLDENGKQVYEKKEVNYAYVKKAFDRKGPVKESKKTTLEQTMKECSEKAQEVNVNAEPSKMMDENSRD